MLVYHFIEMLDWCGTIGSFLPRKCFLPLRSRAGPTVCDDATIGVLIAVVMFVTPANPPKLPDAPSVDAKDNLAATLLSWEIANKMPYDIVFLFGGGFALAKGFVDSGLSACLGEQLGNLSMSLVKSSCSSLSSFG
jgi:sodium-dependent dicarboxylate transporter 2/3/5